MIRRGSRGLVQVEMTTEESRAAPSDRDATHRTKFFPEPVAESTRRLWSDCSRDTFVECCGTN